MLVIKSIKRMQEVSRRLTKQGKTIGFVPTMGFLHRGHMSLVEKSLKENDITILSIFVNPTQFGPKEDFSKYPRDFKKDYSLSKQNNVDILFCPSADDMYQTKHLVYVGVEEMADCLCGRFRPGHFQGVTTVVAKLLNIVLPRVMYLGQKDAQQAIILTKMVSDLNFPTKVKTCPTVRENDGLAMSSRNVYLNPDERKRAAILYKSLRRAKSLIQNGERRADKILSATRAMIQTQNPTKIDYIECRNATTLGPLSRIKGNVLIAMAVWFSKTRLIDNIIIKTR